VGFAEARLFDGQEQLLAQASASVRLVAAQRAGLA
jgi:hypothetical protein